MFIERRVFTNPVNIKSFWPFIVTNPFDVSHFISYIKYLSRHGHEARAVIYDAGVHTVFKDSNSIEYPLGFMNKYMNGLLRVYNMLRYYMPDAELYYVIPDVPVDYPGREHLYPRNVEKTIENILLFNKRYIKKLPGTAIAVVQGAYNDPYSVVKTYKTYKEIYEEFNIIALGNVCSSKKIKLIAKELALFDAITTRPYHTFGLHSNVIKYIVKNNISLCNIISIDSTSYYWDFYYRHGKNKTQEDKARIFNARLASLQELFNKIVCRPGLVKLLIY